MVDVKVPAVGESITEVTIAAWLKADGDIVKMDEPILSIESDKATLEVAAPQAGKLKIIGVSKRTRMAIIGNVPTLAEQGVTDFESGTYQGVMVSNTMPKSHVDALSAALIKVVRLPEIRARLVELGAEVQTSSPVETTQWVLTDRKRWASVIERAGTQIEGTS